MDTKKISEFDEAVKRDIVKFAKTPVGTLELSPSIINSINDVITFSKGSGARKIEGLIDNTGIRKEITNYDDFLIAASRKNGLTNDAWGQLFTGMLKSKNTNEELIKLASSDFIKSEEFVRKYGTFTDEMKLRNTLKSRGYQDPSIDEIVRQMKNDKKFHISTKYAGTVGTVTSETTKVPISKSGFSKISERFKNLSPNAKKGLVALLGLTALAGGGYAVYSIFFKDPNNPTDEELNKFDFPPCVTSLIEHGQGKYLRTKNGGVFVKVKDSLTDEYSSSNGLYFYSNGRVIYGNGSRRGTYSCKGTELSEQIQVPFRPDPLKNINIVWDKVSSPAIKRSVYHTCTNFPFEYGCKSPVIKQIQSLVLMPENEQDGYFGPNTYKSIKDYSVNNGISQEDIIGLNEKPPKISETLYNMISRIKSNKESEVNQKLETPPLESKPLDVPSPSATQPTPPPLQESILADIDEIKNFMKRIL